MKTSFPRMKKTETQEKTGRRIRRTRRRRRTKKRYVRHISLIFYCPYTHSGDAIIVKIKGHSQRTRRPGIRHRSMDRLLWEDGKKFRADRNLHFPKSVNKDSLLGEEGKNFWPTATSISLNQAPSYPYFSVWSCSFKISCATVSSVKTQ